MVKRLLLLVLLFVVLVSCSSSKRSPAGVARRFVESFTSGDANGMLDSMCKGKNSGLVFAVDVDWQYGVYHVEEQQENEWARVKLKGEMVFTAQDIQKFAEEVGIIIPQLSTGAKVGVNYDAFIVLYDVDYKEWCVPRETKNDFFEYLGRQLVNAMRP